MNYTISHLINIQDKLIHDSLDSPCPTEDGLNQALKGEQRQRNLLEKTFLLLLKTSSACMSRALKGGAVHSFGEELHTTSAEDGFSMVEPNTEGNAAHSFGEGLPTAAEEEFSIWLHCRLPSFRFLLSKANRLSGS
ncbi:hypothetical protein CRG98_002145 [Punica granatum]|uniref:Uncharacterized protein n=1 Tax=Punica granatum TaxID=22663 RepID=A0A2I0LA20_PUNGR|nr:hypothetical protein CRG98_002145 [Punica granatum]